MRDPPSGSRRAVALLSPAMAKGRNWSVICLALLRPGGKRENRFCVLRSRRDGDGDNEREPRPRSARAGGSARSAGLVPRRAAAPISPAECGARGAAPPPCGGRAGGWRRGAQAALRAAVRASSVRGKKGPGGIPRRWQAASRSGAPDRVRPGRVSDGSPAGQPRNREGEPPVPPAPGSGVSSGARRVVGPSEPDSLWRVCRRDQRCFAHYPRISGTLASLSIPHNFHIVSAEFPQS
jgi:hypothetical protein